MIIFGRPPASLRWSWADLFAMEMEARYRSMAAWEARRRLNELRESCGVKAPPCTVSVRIPPRYVE